MKKTNKGITLIALIITIVVMLILVGVVVSTTINSNLVNKTKTATEKWQTAEVNDSNIEKVTIGGVEYDGIKGYVQQTLCEHEYGEWETDTKATCIAKGSKHQTCTTCGKTVTEEIEINEDNHDLDADGACTREGCDAQSYIGYYADIDADGEVDGIIYADLAFNGSGQWANADGEYSYTKKDENTLNEYYISQEEEYQYMSFNSKPVIAPVTVDEDNNEANDRFYVMALKDFTTPAYTDEEDETNSYPAYTTYYFYKNACGKMDPSDTEVEFRSDYCVGRKNTNTMISKWDKNGEEGGYTGATQDNQDIWKHIKTKVAEGWFIPSRAEWGAFGKFATYQGVTPGNCKRNYGLSFCYWSSSQLDAREAWDAYFTRGHMDAYVSSFGDYCVRLSATF